MSNTTNMGEPYDPPRPMTPEERDAAYHLLWVIAQYARYEHRNMTAGENALEWLWERGLAIDQGYETHPTPAGEALMDDHAPPGQTRGCLP